MRGIVLSLLRNSALALSAKVVAQLANLFLFVLVARNWGSAEAGVLTLATRYYLLFLTLAVWGLDGLLIWQVAGNRSATHRYLANLGLLRVILGVAAYVILALFVTRVTSYSDHTMRIILLFSLGLIPESVNRLVQAAFFAHERFVYPLIVALLVSGARCVMGGAAILLGGSLELVAAIHAGAALLGLGVYGALLFPWRTAIVPTMTIRPGDLLAAWRRQLDRHFLRQQLGLALPFALMEIFSVVEWQIDAILLSGFVSESEVGYYGAVQTLVSPLFFLLSAYHAAAFPLMTRLYAENRLHLWRLYRRLLAYVGVIILPAAIVLIHLSPTLVNVVYGAAFAPAAIVMPWLIWAVVVQFFDESNSRLIVIAGYQKTVAAFLGLSMTANIMLNLLLIPQYGIVGAARVRLLSTVLFAVVNGVFVYFRISRINPLPTIAKLVFAALLMVGVMNLLQTSGLWMGLIVGGVVYLVALILIRAIPREDLRHLSQTARGLPRRLG